MGCEGTLKNDPVLFKAACLPLDFKLHVCVLASFSRHFLGFLKTGEEAAEETLSASQFIKHCSALGHLPLIDCSGAARVLFQG